MNVWIISITLIICIIILILIFTFKKDSFKIIKGIKAAIRLSSDHQKMDIHSSLYNRYMKEKYYILDQF